MGKASFRLRRFAFVVSKMAASTPFSPAGLGFPVSPAELGFPVSPAGLG